MNLDFKITGKARVAITHYISGLAEEICIPALMKGRVNQNAKEQWMLRGYTIEQTTNLERSLRKNRIDIRVLYEIDGINIVFPQPHLVNEVIGKTLDYRESKWYVE